MVNILHLFLKHEFGTLGLFQMKMTHGMTPVLQTEQGIAQPQMDVLTTAIMQDSLFKFN